MATWKSLEDNVRQYAEYIWDRPAKPDRINGVNYDCVINKSELEIVIIEITENNSLNKIRDDSAKINTVRIQNSSLGIVVRSFIVCDFQPTQGMIDAGKANFVEVISFPDFQKKFFDFHSYKTIRQRKQFGSAIDPVTGKKDESIYTPVRYRVSGSSDEITISDIADKIINGEKIILLGDYGTGKSRCFKELFSELSERVEKSYTYPIAIDLKDTWGLENAVEILRRHFSHLGISEADTNNVVKAYNGDSLCFLLDGFDEIGSKPWNENKKRLEELRRYALQGVKELLTQSSSGFIISGRDHYFNSNAEMFKALGLNEKDVTVIQCKSEFSYEEFCAFLDLNRIDIQMPEWVPKKPLILKTIASMNISELTALFQGDSDSDISIWHKFIEYMCERDSKIHAVLDGDTVKEVLKTLAKKTRNKPLNIGPLSESEIIDAFYEVTNSHPNEQATVMLQRLPGLGRVSSETGDRNFIDDFILDGLRALDVSTVIETSNDKVLNEHWIHPLNKLGSEVLAYDIDQKSNHSIFIDKVKKSIRNNKNNKIIISDIVSALSKSRIDTIDYNCCTFVEPHFGHLDFINNKIENITFSDGIFEELVLGKVDPNNIKIVDSTIEKLIGIPSKEGIPKWIENSSVTDFKSIDTLTSIKNSGLTDGQTILVSILIKVYKQAGNGRLEHTLTKGLTHVNKRILKDILHYLVQNKFLLTSRDRGEKIYKPVRKLQGRIDGILNELDRSKDDLWLYVTKL